MPGLKSTLKNQSHGLLERKAQRAMVKDLIAV